MLASVWNALPVSAVVLSFTQAPLGLIEIVRGDCSVNVFEASVPVRVAGKLTSIFPSTNSILPNTKLLIVTEPVALLRLVVPEGGGGEPAPPPMNVIWC